MSDTLQENALFGHAAALKLDSVTRAIKVRLVGALFACCSVMSLFSIGCFRFLFVPFRYLQLAL